MSSRAPLLLVVALALSGCYSFEASRISKRVGQDIETQTGADAGGAISMSIGPVSLATAQFGAWAFAPVSTREARQIGRNVSSVKFSSRSLTGGFDGRLIEKPVYLDRYDRSGWYPFVTVRDTSAAVWIMLRERGRDQEITNLLAVVVSEENIVVTKVSGDLSAMIRDAIALGSTGTLMGGALEEAGLIEAEEAEEASGDQIEANP